VKPLISIIVPIYNRSVYLGRTITSLLAQTYPDFELILWDDHSSDPSREIAHSYALQDTRIRVVAAPHQGMTGSLKSAFALACGEYLGWVDSDDLLAPTALAETIAILTTHPKIGLVYTDHFIIDEADRILGLGSRCSTPYDKDRLLVNFMVFHFRLFRRTAFEQAGGINPACELVQDYDLCLRLSEITDIYHLHQPLYYYRAHNQSMSQQQQRETIEHSQAAVLRAMQRRGLAEYYNLNVTINKIGTQLLSRFSLKSKPLN
jgi:glycosyltransferase involved in cell wall biosynthesis